MKSRFALLLFLLAGTVCTGQYTVTKVIGVVKNKVSGETLKTGSKLTDEDMLIFTTPNDVVRVIVAGKGVYVISPVSRPQGQQSEIVEMLRTALHVKYKEGYLSGRSKEYELIPAVLETQSAMNGKNLIKEVNKYIFDADKFSPSKGRFFLQIEVPGTQAIIHPLRASGDTLIVYAADFKAGDHPASAKAVYKLGFFSKELNSSESLALIHPYVDSTGEMESIISVILQENTGAEQAKMEQDCYLEVYEALGKPSGIVFKNIFNSLSAKKSK